MTFRVAIFIVVGVGFALAWHAPGSAQPAGGTEKKVVGEEYGFGDKVLLVVVRPAGALQLGTACIEKARVRILGDRCFVVGRVPDYSDVVPGQLNIGSTYWIPMSEVLMISEHESAKAALKSSPGLVPPVQEPTQPGKNNAEPMRPNRD